MGLPGLIRPVIGGASRARSAARAFLQVVLNPRGEPDARAAEHAPHDANNVLERRHGLAEIVERRAVVITAPRSVDPTSS